MSRATITVNIERVQLSSDAHLFHLTLEQLVLNCPNQTRSYEVELHGEVRSIHFECLAIRFVVYILISATKHGGIARCGEEV